MDAFKEYVEIMIFCIVCSQLPSPPPTYSRLRWRKLGPRVERSALRKVSISPFCLGATLFNNNAPNIPASFSIIPGLLAPLFSAACIAPHSQRRLLGFRDSRRLCAPPAQQSPTRQPRSHPLPILPAGPASPPPSLSPAWVVSVRS